MRRFLCFIGLHDCPWPPHRAPHYRLWEEFWIECARGCGAREVRKCYPDWHWRDRHPEEARDG